MTVTTSYAPLTHNCNGSATTFNVTWPFFLSSDLVVTHITSGGVETVLTLTTDYTVSGGRDSTTGLPAVGTITTVATYAAGVTLRITRATPKTQSTSFTTTGAFPAKTVEAMIDRVHMIAEEGAGGSPAQDVDGASLRLETGGATDYWDGEGYIARGFANGENDDDLATVAQLAEVANAAVGIVSANSLLGNNTASAGPATSLTVSQVRSLLSINNTDNTSDASKPISTATQTALDLKAPLASPPFTGTAGFTASTETNAAVNATNGATTAAALTHSAGKYLARFANTQTTGNSIYDAIFPTVEHYEAGQFVTQITNGSTVENAAAVAGFVINDDDGTAGGGTNAVALFGVGQATRNNAHVWGLNTLLMDAATRTAGTDTGRYLIGAELDFNVMNPDTIVIGASVGGNSLAQPTSANGFMVNVLGTGYKWTTAFVSQDGVATNGMSLGALATSGSNISSQPFLLQYFNSGGTKKYAQIQASNNRLTISNNDTDLTVSVTGYVNVPTGKGFAVNNTLVIGPRKTGWATATGTATRTTFDTATVTTTQLAERVKALIDDLHNTAGHGLIGS